MIAAFGEREMIQLSDVGITRLDAVDEPVLETAISNAGKLIDGYLVGRYALPLATPVPALQMHCCGLARYLLMSNTPDERAKNDYSAAMKYLSGVASGTFALLPPSQAPSPAGLGPVSFNTGQKVFAREEADGE